MAKCLKLYRRGRGRRGPFPAITRPAMRACISMHHCSDRSLTQGGTCGGGLRALPGHPASPAAAPCAGMNGRPRMTCRRHAIHAIIPCNQSMQSMHACDRCNPCVAVSHCEVQLQDATLTFGKRLNCRRRSRAHMPTHACMFVHLAGIECDGERCTP